MISKKIDLTNKRIHKRNEMRSSECFHDVKKIY